MYIGSRENAGSGVQLIQQSYTVLQFNIYVKQENVQLFVCLSVNRQNNRIIH